MLAGSGAASAAIVGGVLAWGVIGSSPAPRARQYIAFTVCLLTDSRGLASPQAAAAWAGLQEASAATRAKVQYQPVMSGSTEGAAAPYLAGLVAQQCRVVVATGPAQAAAVRASARRFPSVRFAVVNAAARAANVTAVRGSAGQIRSAIAALVRSAVGRSGPSH